MPLLLSSLPKTYARSRLAASLRHKSAAIGIYLHDL